MRSEGNRDFDNFKDLVEALSPQALGYDSEEEVLIRLNRMYSIDLQRELNAVAFLLRRRLLICGDWTAVHWKENN